MVQRRANGPLRFQIAFHHDVALPELVPLGFMAAQQTFAAFQLGKNGEAFGLVVRVVIGMRGHSAAHHAEPVGFAGFQFFVKLRQVHVVVPVFVYDFRFLSVRLLEDKTGGSRHRVAPGRTFAHRSEQRNEDVRAVNFAVIIAHIGQVYRRFDDAHGRNGNVLFSCDLHHAQGRVRQVPQRQHGVPHAQLSAHIESGEQHGSLHVQGLSIVGNIAATDATTVHVQVHVQMVERFEDVAHPAPLVIIVSAVEHHILHAHGFG